MSFLAAIPALAGLGWSVYQGLKTGNDMEEAQKQQEAQLAEARAQLMAYLPQMQAARENAMRQGLTAWGPANDFVQNTTGYGVKLPPTVPIGVNPFKGTTGPVKAY